MEKLFHTAAGERGEFVPKKRRAERRGKKEITLYSNAINCSRVEKGRKKLLLLSFWVVIEVVFFRFTVCVFFFSLSSRSEHGENECDFE